MNISNQIGIKGIWDDINGLIREQILKFPISIPSLSPMPQSSLSQQLPPTRALAAPRRGQLTGRRERGLRWDSDQHKNRISGEDHSKLKADFPSSLPTHSIVKLNENQVWKYQYADFNFIINTDNEVLV